MRSGWFMSLATEHSSLYVVRLPLHEHRMWEKRGGGVRACVHVCVCRNMLVSVNEVQMPVGITVRHT